MKKQILKTFDDFTSECLKLKDGIHKAEVLGSGKDLYLAVGDNLSQTYMAVEEPELLEICTLLNLRYIKSYNKKHEK